MPHLRSSDTIPSWWPAILARATREPQGPRVPLRIASQPAGSIAPPLLALLHAAGLPIAPDAALLGAPDTALAQIADWLRANGHAGRWRNEALAVTDVSQITNGPALARVERGVVRNLGIHTTAVQLHARQAGTGRWWLQQRALDKATDPGLWDTLMGGLVSAGESIDQALQREAWEEAGVRLERHARAPENCGHFTVRRPVQDSGSHGYLVETVHVFACTLAADEVPANQDGEVLRFEAFTDDAIDALVTEGRLTLEAAVAVALCRAPALRA